MRLNDLLLGMTLGATFALGAGLARADCDPGSRWLLELADVKGDGNVESERDRWPGDADLTNTWGGDLYQQFNGDVGNTHVTLVLEVSP